jgi:hypothetical protein
MYRRERRTVHWYPDTHALSGPRRNALIKEPFVHEHRPLVGADGHRFARQLYGRVYSRVVVMLGNRDDLAVVGNNVYRYAGRRGFMLVYDHRHRR